MSYTRKFSPLHFSARSLDSRGAALVVVLSMLLLVTVMVMAFFSGVSGEHRLASTGSNLESTRHLSEAAVQIVMGQIRAGTSQADTAWASQPGLIRTYGADGAPKQAFALYSSETMIRAIGSSGFRPSVDLPPARWSSDRSLWVDLNAPVKASTGKFVFPILDPRAATVINSGQSLVEGFTFDVAEMEGAVLPKSESDASARVPMPVRWIYVLNDGQLATPSQGTGGTVTFSAPGPVPSVDNPIIGRIAFWTDDETCKININTACGGVPWDTPIGNSGLEMLFARYQPAKNEFSRYPGHPATVSLAPALWHYLGLASPAATLVPSFTPADGLDTSREMKQGPTLSAAGAIFKEKVFPLIPRNTWGGSRMATRPTSETSIGIGTIAAVDSDRLFSSSDELLYGPREGGLGRSSNPLNLSAPDVALLSFFLTAQSRAPEVNPFNLPKIVIWPIPDASKKSVFNPNAVSGDTRSAIDRLIAFCSTLSYAKGGKKREYAFTRYDSTSAKADIDAIDAYGTANNTILYNYLRWLMGRPMPGFGGNFSTRYGMGGTNQILTGIYDFIRAQINLLDTSYSDSDPTSPQNDQGKFVSRYAYAASVSGLLSDGGLDGPAGQVIPAKMPNGTHGSGRFPVVSQVALEFIARAANQPPHVGNPMHPWIPGDLPYPTMDLDADAKATAYDAKRSIKFWTHPGLRFLTIPNGGATYDIPNPRYRGSALNLYQTEIEPTFLINFSLPEAGTPGYRQSFNVQVLGLQSLKVNNGESLFASRDSETYKLNPNSTVWQFNIGPSKWPAIIGNVVTVGDAADFGSTFPFIGGTVEIRLLNPADNTLIQTYTLNFPPATFPTPLLPNPLPADSRARDSHSFWSGTTKPSFPPVKVADLPPSSLLTFDVKSDLATTPNYPSGNTYSGARANTRWESGSGASRANMILPQWPVSDDYRGKLSSDTVRSLEVAYGDARMLTQLGKVPASMFLPHRFYFDKKMRAAHSLRDNQYETQFEQLHGATLQYLTNSYTKVTSFPTYGGAWLASAPKPASLWDVATAEDVQHMSYSYFVIGNAASAAKWPFTASTSEFDETRFAKYKGSDSSLGSVTSFSTIWSQGGDFSSGGPGLMDGAMLGKVDEGNNRIQSRGLFPYFNELAATSIQPTGPNLFSPNRQVFSPVVLGSIPAGYKPTFNAANPRLVDMVPWKTLLFSPNPVSKTHDALSEVSEGGAVPHTGSIPDFALLDFFWMPVIEPYAISEPLSTAGKVNMNAQIAPFTYITRDTALRGVLRSTLLTAIPDKWLNNKNTTGSGTAILGDLGGSSGSINYANFRYPIECNQTLKQFTNRFSAGDIFRSPSEICSLWLYPDKRSPSDNGMPTWDVGSSSIKSWWYDNPGTECKSVTGDNLRERPYSSLYPLLTTKSNTYTVHYKVQSLKKALGSSQSVWKEDVDRVTGEMQGSQMIERYVDPTDPNLPDFASNVTSTKPNLSDYYRFRILNNKRFNP